MTDSAGIVLRSVGAEAVVATTGAELVRWSVGGREMLWTADSAIWARTAPILFPFVGLLRGGVATIDGMAHVMPVHGFAASSPFDVEAADARAVRLVLRSNEATRAMYPFDFALAVSYALDAASVTTRIEVTNTGSRAMPYGCGVHPGFRWPLDGGARDGHAVVFDAAERADVPVIMPHGLFTRRTRALDFDGRRLALSDSRVADQAICFLDAASRGFALASPSGLAVHVAVAGLPHLAVWSRPGAPFLCLEAWTTHGDFEDWQGSFEARPHTLILAPGDRAVHSAVYTVATA